ncbi:hypothetical protein BDZ97DRAFT_977834 [Flammula alnicola]|nr:hypothetical protein BDZ97DRAFT_977834 [Flammula alnicola]
MALYSAWAPIILASSICSSNKASRSASYFHNTNISSNLLYRCRILFQRSKRCIYCMPSRCPTATRVRSRAQQCCFRMGSGKVSWRVTIPAPDSKRITQVLRIAAASRLSYI